MKKVNWIDHILHRNCLQEDIIEGKMHVEVRRDGTAK